MKDQLSNTEALLMRLKKELNGKPEYSSQTSEELDRLIDKIKSAHIHDVSKAKKQAIISECLLFLGIIVKHLPEVADFLHSLN